MGLVKVVQFRYDHDNLSYLVHNEEEAVAVDGGAVKEIMNYLYANSLRLKAVVNTHTHQDHTSGDRILLDQTPASYFDYKDLFAEKSLQLGKTFFTILATPGHTMDSVCFLVDEYLLTGDTLFNGTIGNCFSGDMIAFFQSLKKILALPEQTIIYAGHDYLVDSIRFAKRIEPENSSIDHFYRENMGANKAHPSLSSSDLIGGA